MGAEQEESLNTSDAGHGPHKDNDAPSMMAMFRELLGTDSVSMDCLLAASMITRLVQGMDPTLDLSRLLRWVVEEDIYEAAERLSVELEQDIRLTKTENSVSSGRIIETEQGSILLLPASIFRNLIDGPDSMVQFTINLLHHELCHVHDEAVRRSMPFWNDHMIGRPLTNRMIDLMIPLWDEYSANRRSVKTIQAGVEKLQFELVVTEYPSVRDEVADAIESWREHGDMGHLFSELMPPFRHILKLLGYVLGSAAGRGIRLEEFDPLSYGYVRGTWLASLLETESIEQLDTLYQTFGKWSGIEVFDQFAETCRLVFWDAGIHIYAGYDNLKAEII